MEPQPKPDTPRVKRIVPSARWDDLALTDESLQQLRHIAQRAIEVRRAADRALDGQPRIGIIAVFSGAPGKAKGLAAEVLAKHLGADLMTVDLSAVISKYIGETEKNLRRLFVAAEESGAVLFFDEADALFGKRTDVKDSHDRYENQESGHLLQRMEAFAGLTILATNSPDESSMAAIGRSAVEVHFPAP